MEIKITDILEAIKTRRSVREFEQRTVGRDELASILEAGRWAPSGLNNQPWRYVIVEDEAKKVKLADLTKYSSILLLAPTVIAVFLDNEASYSREKDILAIGASIQNMLLQVHGLGLGACWLGEILNKSDDVKRLLEVPYSYDLMAVIAIGHPKVGRTEEISNRRGFREIVFGTWPFD